jgi:hypothetical protein
VTVADVDARGYQGADLGGVADLLGGLDQRLFFGRQMCVAIAT